MTEQWAIAVFGVGIGIISAFLGWIVMELKGLHADVKRFVIKEDCTRWMDEHEKKIDQLDQLMRDQYERLDVRIRTHGHQLAAIEECHNRLNPGTPLITKNREIEQ